MDDRSNTATNMADQNVQAPPPSAMDVLSGLPPQAPPDFNMPTATPVLATQNPPDGQQAQPTQPKQSTWRRVLGGLLYGLMDNGIPGAIGGAIDPDTAKQVYQNAKQENNLRVKMVSAQAADAVAQASIHDQQLHSLPQQIQDEHNASAAQTVKNYSSVFGSPDLVVSNTGQEAMTALENMTKTQGAVPHMMIVNTGNQLVAWNMDKAAVSDQTVPLLNKAGKAGNPILKSMTQAQWDALPQQTKSNYLAQMNNVLGVVVPSHDPREQQSQVATLNQQLATVKALPDSDPDKAGLLEHLNTNLKLLTTAANSGDAREINQAVAKSRAEAAARLPFEMHKAKLDEAIKDGDPRAAAQLLVKGVVAPSQLISSRKPAFAQQAFTLATQLDSNWNAQKAEAQYKYATAPATQNTLNYLGSLVGEGKNSGNLDALVGISDKITRTQFPALNDAAAWTRLEAGDPNIVAYHTAVVEVADQFAKIMQGGGSGSGTSDAKIRQATEMFGKGFNKDQIKAVATTAKTLLANRKREMIRDNPALISMYGGGEAPQGGGQPQRKQGGKASDDPFAKFGGKARQ